MSKKSNQKKFTDKELKNIQNSKRKNTTHTKTKPKKRDIISYLKKIFTTNKITIIISFVTLIITCLTFSLDLDKEKNELNIYIGEYEITNGQGAEILFLAPVTQLKVNKLYGNLPLSLYNSGENIIENLQFIVSSPLIEEEQKTTTIGNSIIKMPQSRIFKSMRFIHKGLKKDTITPLGRVMYAPDFDKNIERMVYFLNDINPKTGTIINLRFNIDTLNMHPDLKEVLIYDLVMFDLSLGHKKIKNNYLSTIGIAILNCDNLVEIIDAFYLKDRYPPIMENNVKDNPEDITYKEFIVVNPIFSINEAKEMNQDSEKIKSDEINYNVLIDDIVKSL